MLHPEQNTLYSRGTAFFGKETRQKGDGKPFEEEGVGSDNGGASPFTCAASRSKYDWEGAIAGNAFALHSGGFVSCSKKKECPTQWVSTR